MKFVPERKMGELCVPDDCEYIEYVRDILENEQFCSMKNFIQHGETTCLTHSINVSYLSHLFCKAHHLNAKAARAAAFCTICFYIIGTIIAAKKASACTALSIRAKH